MGNCGRKRCKTTAEAYHMASLPTYVDFCAGRSLLLLFGFFPGKLLGAVWMLAPAVFASLSRPLKPIESMKEDYGAVYERYAADIWKYFERYVTEEDQYLPPDNIQLIPELTIAHRTSPTNIGLYL